MSDDLSTRGAARGPLEAVRASAPGKLILMGEHAAVYGRPALVAAVDLRLTATLERLPPGGRDDGRIRLRVLGSEHEARWPEVLEFTRTVRAAWQEYAAAPSPERFERVRPSRDLGPGRPGALDGPDGDGGSQPFVPAAARHVLLSLGEAALRGGDAPPPERLPSLQLTIDSELPLGAGFGSSAATAVATIRAYAALVGDPLTESRLHRLSLEVERRQHGLPSGIDNATVIRGGTLWVERRQDGPGESDLAVEPVAVRSPLLSRLRVVDSGTPAESTGAVVAAVRARADRDRGVFDAHLDAIQEQTERFREMLEAVGEDPAAALETIRRVEGHLEALGAVPEAARRLVRAIEAEGGAAKISGAGGLAGPGAGTLLVYHPHPERVDRWPFLEPLPRRSVTLGGEGVRLEPLP